LYTITKTLGVDGIKIAKAFLYGLIFGFASPIPGVSAGTMAVLLNVYEGFFKSISIAYVRKNIFTTVSFLAGWGFGLYSVSSLMLFLFDNYGRPIAFGFIGLIVGCLPMIYKKATVDRVRYKSIGVFVFALVFMLFLALYGGGISTGYTIAQLDEVSPLYLAWVFTASFISSAAMLIPGVGGSLMMIVFGIYTLYIEAVALVHPLLLGLFALSMVLGVLAGIAVIKKMLERFAQTLYFAILGFIIGSLFIIYPGFALNAEGVLSVVLAALLAWLAYWLSGKER
jgi:putative membrane protein